VEKDCVMDAFGLTERVRLLWRRWRLRRRRRRRRRHDTHTTSVKALLATFLGVGS